MGVSMVAIYSYWNHKRIGHIGVIAVSYCLLIGVATHSLYVEAYPRLSGKGAVVFLAYLLGDFALIKLLTHETNGSAGAQSKEFWEAKNRELFQAAVAPVAAEVAEIKASLANLCEKLNGK